MLVSRTVFWYASRRKRDDTLLRQRMKDIAATRVRYGFERIEILLRREGFTDNHKRMYRVYREEELNLRSKRPRRCRSASHRLERLEPTAPHQMWSMDFVADNLFDGRKFRALTVVDNFSRKSVKIEVGQSLTGEAVVGALEDIRHEEGIIPDRIQVDNGTEFTSKAFDLWAHENNVVIDYSRPGKPTDNPFIESFNGSFRDECLSTNWFLSIDDAKEKIEAFRQDYNSFRPHSSLGGLTPNQVIEEYLKDSNFLILERY